MTCNYPLYAGDFCAVEDPDVFTPHVFTDEDGNAGGNANGDEDDDDEYDDHLDDEDFSDIDDEDWYDDEDDV